MLLDFTVPRHTRQTMYI